MRKMKTSKKALLAKSALKYFLALAIKYENGAVIMVGTSRIHRTYREILLVRDKARLMVGSQTKMTAV